MRVREPLVVLVVLPTVVVLDAAVAGRGCRVGVLELRGGHGHAQVPEFHALVLAVAEDVPPVALAVDVRQALGVPDEGAGLSAVAHAPRVPDFDGAVVRARVEDVRRHLVGEADGVHVVRVAPDVVARLASFDIVHHDRVVARAGDKVAPVS